MATTKQLEEMIDKIICMVATLAHIEDVETLKNRIKGASSSSQKIDLLMPRKNDKKP